VADTPKKRSFLHWTVLIPLLALSGWAIGFVVERLTDRPEAPMEVTPAPQAALTPVALQPRARSLSGKVVGPQSEPIAGALVALVAGDEPHWTYTDDAGGFLLSGIARGPWSVNVVATAHDPLSLTLPDDAKPAEIRLPDSQHQTPKIAAVERAPWSGRIDAAPDVIARGFEVVLTPVLPLETLSGPVPRRLLCDAEGRFAIADLITGEYTLAVLPSWAQGGSWPDLARGENDAPRKFVHAKDAAAEVAVTIEAGAISGVVLDREGNPLEGALVLLASARAAEKVWPPVTADPRGAFLLRDLPAGRYALSVRAAGGSAQLDVEVRPRETLAVDLPPLDTARPH
jgi:hypothetical protein